MGSVYAQSIMGTAMPGYDPMMMGGMQPDMMGGMQPGMMAGGMMGYDPMMGGPMQLGMMGGQGMVGGVGPMISPDIQVDMATQPASTPGDDNKKLPGQL